MIYFLCFAPVLVAVLYSFYLLLKKKSVDDEFFHLSRKTRKEVIVERIRLLEQLNDSDYSLEIIDIDHFYSDGRITEREALHMEKIITNTYFNHFEGRWASFRRADLFMKVIFLLFLLYGFFYVNLVFIAAHGQLKAPDVELGTMLIIVNASLILPYLFALILLGFLSTFLAMLNLKFSGQGGINRAAVTSEELIRSLKPGGRKTKIVLGKAWSKPVNF